MNKRIMFVALAAMILSAIACGPLMDFLDSQSSPDAPAAPVEPAAPAAGGAPSCESPAVGLALNGTYNQTIYPAGDSYPDNCTYYCVDVPSGQNAVDMTLTGLSSDLDIFVGYGSMASVQTSDPGENTWLSNEFDTADEAITINSPSAGTYYIEICSYEGTSSSFDLGLYGR